MNGLALNESGSCLCYKITVCRHVNIESRDITGQTEIIKRENEEILLRDIMKIRTRIFWITLLCSVADLMPQCRTAVEDWCAEERWPGDNHCGSCLREGEALHILM